MTSPISSLKKYRRTPFPDQNEGGKGPFTARPNTDCEANLLAEIPHKNGPAQGPMNHLPITRPKGKQRKNQTTCSPPSDYELLSAMIQKISILERKVKVQALDNESKVKKIAELEEKLKRLQMSKGTEETSKNNPDKDLFEKCHKLQKQAQEMERFLNDYGLIWVGSSEEYDQASQHASDSDEQTESSWQNLWKPGTSVVKKFHINFDLILKNIQELNVLAGEGVSYVKATAGGAKLAQQDPVPLWLYRNGIIMFNGPFRSFKEPSTQQLMQDFMDGYFPSELQERFPKGVPFQVHDRRNEEFEVRQICVRFPGRGQSIAGRTDQSSDRDECLNEITFHKGEIPGKKLSMKQFLSKLPATVVKAGKVIDIRDSIETCLRGSSYGTSSVTVIETPMQQACEPSTAHGKITTLRVRSENGEQTFLLKMHISETIGQLRQYLDAHRQSTGLPYDIISAFPRRCYHDNSRTLLSCGLNPNAVLFLCPRSQKLNHNNHTVQVSNTQQTRDEPSLASQ